jgi:hypothetical protein
MAWNIMRRPKGPGAFAWPARPGGARGLQEALQEPWEGRRQDPRPNALRAHRRGLAAGKRPSEVPAPWLPRERPWQPFFPGKVKGPEASSPRGQLVSSLGPRALSGSAFSPPSPHGPRAWGEGPMGRHWGRPGHSPLPKAKRPWPRGPHLRRPGLGTWRTGPPDRPQPGPPPLKARSLLNGLDPKGSKQNLRDQIHTAPSPKASVHYQENICNFFIIMEIAQPKKPQRPP